MRRGYRPAEEANWHILDMSVQSYPCEVILKGQVNYSLPFTPIDQLNSILQFFTLAFPTKERALWE